MKDSDIIQCVQVKVEIGHRATPRLKPTKEGFTHDWMVYVRAKDGCNLAHFVKKVEFHLHDTYADPLRVVNQTPYHISEVGYADFGLPIEIYFRNKGEPQKIKFNYNLFLQAHEPVNYVQCEKLTFVNPTDDFKRRLIEAGGVRVLPPEETQFAHLFGSPIQFETSTISTKEKVSKQILIFSSSSGINTSLISTAKDVKIDDKRKGHDAASTLLSSSSNSISKDNVQKSQSSKEKHSSKESNNTSKMVPNLYPLPPLKRPSESPIPSENNQTKIRRCSSASIEMFMNEDKQRSEGKAIKESSKVLKNESKLKDDTVSKFDDKKQAKDNKEENNGISSVSVNDCFREITGSDSGVDCGIIKIVSQNYSISSLTKLLDELSLNSADDNDGIINTVDVFSGPKSSDRYSPLVVSVKEGECSEDISPESDDDFSREITLSDSGEDFDISPTFAISKTSNKIFSRNALKQLMEDELENNSGDDDDDITHDVDIDSQSNSSKGTLVELKEDLSLSNESSSESDDDFFLDSSESDMDIALSLTSNLTNTSNHTYTLSDLKILMAELDSSEDDEDDRKYQTTTNEEKSKQRKRSGSPISTLFG